MVSNGIPPAQAEESGSPESLPDRFMVRGGFAYVFCADTSFGLDRFYADTGNFKGSMNEVYLGLEYRLFQHFALGGVYNRLAIDVESDPKSGAGFTVQNEWNMLYGYGSLFF